MSQTSLTSVAEQAFRQRQQFRDDPHRPQYHFLPPANWMNDPNGVIHHQGKYHLFYQHNVAAPVWGHIHWGHAVSDDLVHWHDLPIALTPTPGGADDDGCWSGCAVIHEGVPTLIYTGVNKQNGQQACLATSDDDLIVWDKYPDNPIIPGAPDGLQVLGFRDHSLWQEDSYWYQIIGSGTQDVGGMVFLYRSRDLRHWEYLHPLLTGDKDQREPLWSGLMWECPQFFQLGDKHALLLSIHDGQNGFYTAYYTGTYRDQRFYPETFQKLDYGDMNFYAPQMCFDAQGRALLWGWIPESRSIDAQKAAGWAGVMSLPRVLEMRGDGRFAMRPAPELEALRTQHTRHTGSAPVVTGRAIELRAEFTVTDAQKCGIKLSSSPEQDEYVHVCYDAGRQTVGLELMQAAVNAGQPKIYEGELALEANEPLTLRIFVDHSVIEVYANERICLTGRFYPAQTDSLTLTYDDGNAPTTIDIWELKSIWRL